MEELNKIMVVGAVVIFVILAAALCFKLKNIFKSEFKSELKLVMSLSVNDFKTRFAGSYFGIVWAFVQPICTILIFWFVFQVGLRNSDVGNVPFILWFMSGLIPWFFFSEAWNGATNCFMEYSYLVKKVVFKIEILPVIKIISAFFIQIFFIIFMLVVFACYGRYPSVYTLQLIYYALCMIVLVRVLSYITAPIMVFFKDLGQIMNIVLQFGMWLTPIMWSISNLPYSNSLLTFIFKLNPMYYVVQGYRDCMIYKVWFFCNIKQTLYFWILIIVLHFAGKALYKRLKPHFADVL